MKIMQIGKFDEPNSRDSERQDDDNPLSQQDDYNDEQRVLQPSKANVKSHILSHTIRIKIKNY